MINPFCYGKIVSGKNFCPRKDSEERLESNIRRGQNTYIMGERRIGKTSLIEFVCTKLKKDYLQISVDLRMLESLEDFEKRVLAAILKAEATVSDFKKILTMFTSYKPTMSLDPITGESSFSFKPIEKSSLEDVETLFDHISDLNERKKVVVVFDEFQDIFRLDNHATILAKMRAKIQKQSKICYIFSGSIKENVQKIFNEPSQAMYNSAEPISLDSINKEEFNSFLIAKFKEGGNKIEQSVLNLVYDLTDNITGDTQQLCSSLWEVSERNEVISNEAFPKALALIDSMRSEDFERVLDNMTNLQLKILKALAWDRKSKVQSQVFMERVGHRNFTAVAKAVLQLQKRNVIYFYHKEYKFYSPFLREWLKKRS